MPFSRQAFAVQAESTRVPFKNYNLRSRPAKPEVAYEAAYTKTGFPFDKDFDRNRDGSFRTKLDDIAKRHPEFAEHLQRFPRRSSASRTEDPTEEYVRRFERPFGSRFERFGFPFDDEFDRGEPQSTKKEQYQSPQSSSHHQSEPQYNQLSPQYQHPESKQTSTNRSDTEQSQSCSSSESQPQEPTRGRTRNIQQSNTVDLGQKQEEALNERNQRSMSAPPSDNRQGQRFVSSINIPINRETDSGHHRNMGKQYSTQPQGGSHSQGITERVIPIHVEGRDDPVLPKNVQQNFGHHQPQQQSPQPERIFGQRPEQFTQFVREPRASQFPSDWNHPTGFDRHVFPEEEEFTRKKHSPSHQQFQQRTSSPQRQPPHRPSTPQHQQQPKSQEQQAHAQQAPPPKSETPPPQPQAAKTQPQPKQPLAPVEQIQSIQKDVSELLKQVEEFKGAPKDKQYLYLDEMLTRNLLKLDNVDTQGQDTIRSARKEAIKCIEKGIGALEARAAANVAPRQQENIMEVEQQGQEKNEGDKEETMDTAEEKCAEPQPMEVATDPVKGQDIKAENLAAPKEQIEDAKVEENVPLEEPVVNVKDAVSNIEQSRQKEGNITEHEEHTEETKEKVESGQQKEETNENSGTKDETKAEEKKEKKKIKKKAAADKEKKQK